MIYTFRFDIKDSDGDHRYDYSNDFVITLDRRPDGDNAGFRKNLYKKFKEQIKNAVTRWFEQDPEAVRDEISQYGYGYDFVTNGSIGESEVEFAIDNFPARCVAHIPEDITRACGFYLEAEPNAGQEFYNDNGFLND